MKTKAVTGIMLSLLLIVMLILIFNFQPVKASGTIYIRADGSVEGTTHITSVDNITYTFTNNIYDSIVVERDNVIVDGAGYTLQGPALEWWGINLTGRSNVTIKNMKIKAFDTGICLESSSNNTVSGNNITANDYAGILLYDSSNYNIISGNNITNHYRGVCLESSSNNTVSGNNITANDYTGIDLYDSSNYNIVSGNTITNNYWGIQLELSSNNSISGNNITANNRAGIYLYHSFDNSISGNNITNNYDYGVYLYSSSNNTISGNNITNNTNDGVRLVSSSDNNFYHNNFIDNPRQVYILTSGYVNVWDHGYPSGGNYWSDYAGVDEKSGPDQDQLGSDGIGDTSYIIDDDNIDHYPLISPYPQTPDFHIVVSPSTGTTAQGTTVTTNVYVSTIAGYDYLVSLSASGQPEGVTIAFNPNTGTPYFTSTMTIQVGDSVPLNIYPITVTGLGSDGTTHSTTYTLTFTTVVPEFPLGVEAAATIALMVALAYIWLKKRARI